MLIQVNDGMQKYYAYELTEPVGKNFHPEFTPELTPKEMLELGVFNGKYLNTCQNEFPNDWFKNAKLFHGESQNGNPELNYFKVRASQPLEEWQKKGWINPQDPRGWFQWYCRYFMGRRSPDDLRQIKRWKAMKRHIAQIKNNCQFGDLQCRQKQRQALLHWAYDSINM